MLRRGRRPWREADWCVVDIETTGFDPRTDDVISYAAIPIRSGRIEPGGAISALVRPRRAPSGKSVLVHGLRGVDLAQAPPLTEVIGALCDALDSAELVVHHGAVERSFLSPAFRAAGVRFPRRFADTEVLGRLWYHHLGQDEPGHLPLVTLARRLGLPVHRQHDAMGDALTTAQAFIALASHLEESGAETVALLTRADRRLANARMARPRLGPTEL